MASKKPAAPGEARPPDDPASTKKPHKPRKSAAPKSPEVSKTPKTPKARKPKAAAVALPAGAPPPAPPWDAPLAELERDALSVFVYVALLPEQTEAAVKDLGLSLPGFRREALGDVQRADLLADEIRAAPQTRSVVLDPLRKDFREPPFSHIGLDVRAASEALALLDHEDAVPLTLWRLLCDADPAVREVAAKYLDGLAADYYGEPGDRKAPAPRGAASPEERLAEAERKLAAAREEREALKNDYDARLESQRRKGEEQREKLQEWLKDARARESAARDEAARAREAAEVARRGEERLAASLAAAKAEDQAQELHRARTDLKDLEGRASSLEARLERARARERELEAELERARVTAPAPAGSPQPGTGEDEEPEEAPATWLFPVYTREFYDSLDRWDRRIQRAAFKQAALLAQDHRHPSLRALPLEGLPGYYRVRVATDVRLLYRRPERQNTIEILSLIDREDLDRYIKQAKTR